MPPQFGGLGLGLAIAKAIVDAHGEQIHAKSLGAGRGATFAVTLQLAETQQSANAQLAPAKSPAANKAVRILLVRKLPPGGRRFWIYSHHRASFPSIPPILELCMKARVSILGNIELT